MAYNNNENKNYPYDSYPIVEVPIPKKMSKSDKIIILIFILAFVCIMIFGFLGSILKVSKEVFAILVMVTAGIFFLNIPVVMIIDTFAQRNRLRKVCTVPVTGKLVGYETRRKRNKNIYYDVYAPKYKIFLNNRYEIRTLNDFTKNKSQYKTEIHLLANPGGYEIMPRDGGISHSGKNNLIYAIALLTFFIVTLVICFTSTTLP